LRKSPEMQQGFFVLNQSISPNGRKARQKG